MFPTTLIKMARSWYKSLPTLSIIRFKQFKKLFLGQFLANKRQVRMMVTVYKRQGSTEPLKGYIKRFTITYVGIRNPNEGFMIETFRARAFSDHIHYALYGSDIVEMHGLVAKA